jgi:acyl carrier protein
MNKPLTHTFERLSAMLARDPKLTLDRLTPDAPLDGLGIDSLGMVDVMWNVEEEFRIKVPLKMPDLRTVADVVRYIDLLATEQGGPAQPSPGPAAAAAPRAT